MHTCTHRIMEWLNLPSICVNACVKMTFEVRARNLWRASVGALVFGNERSGSALLTPSRKYLYQMLDGAGHHRDHPGQSSWPLMVKLLPSKIQCMKTLGTSVPLGGSWLGHSTFFWRPCNWPDYAWVRGFIQINWSRVAAMQEHGSTIADNLQFVKDLSG